LAFTNVVGREPPFQRTVDVFVKFDPLTVSVSAPLPAGAVGGLRLVIAGVAVGAVIVKTELFVDTPVALTVTVAVPCDAIELAAMEAFN